MSEKNAKRADTSSEKVLRAQRLKEGIIIPAHIHLRPCDLPFWNSVIITRAIETWTEVDLTFAAQLARCNADIDRLQIEMESEEDVITLANGAKQINKKHELIEILIRRSVSIASKIQVHAGATVGVSKLSRGKNSVQREIIQTINKNQDDNLLARPTH